MNLDLHVHSVFSGDSPVQPVEYARRVLELQAEYHVDGFVLMEHNHFISNEECDLESIARDHGMVILSGVEVDTYWGHLLIYGMTDRLWKKIEDSGSRKQEPVAVARLAEAEGALIVPAHPFRGWIGMGEKYKDLAGACTVETINASNSEHENRFAINFAAKTGMAAIGGSDAHFLLELGRAMTRFESPVSSMEEVIREIRAGRCRAITLEQARIE